MFPVGKYVFVRAAGQVGAAVPPRGVRLGVPRVGLAVAGVCRSHAAGGSAGVVCHACRYVLGLIDLTGLTCC